MECVGQVEFNPFCQAVLKKYWPDVKRIGDIHDVKGNEFGAVELVCGGFPCQPFSTAGKRKGKSDDRYLWPEMLRIISAIKPSWVIGENVAGIVNMELEQVCTDLEKEGYEVQPIIIPACAVNAPHRRDRVWILGIAKHNGQHGAENRKSGFEGSDSNTCWQNENGESEGSDLSWDRIEKSKTEHEFYERLAEELSADTKSQQTLSAESGGFHTEPCSQNSNDSDSGNKRLQRGERNKSHDQRKATHGSTSECDIAWNEQWPSVAARLCRMDDGISNRVHRLKALGNSIVPQIVEEIGKAIMQINEDRAQEG